MHRKKTSTAAASSPTPSQAATAAASALGVSAAAGLTGTGVKVGVISDSFDALGAAPADEADGALPASVDVLKDSATGRDEGRAMAQVVHGIAGGAQILFSAAGGTVSGLAGAIASLQAAGCSVICDDVSFSNEPFWQMGSAAENAIASFTAAGGIYLTAASNAGPDSDYGGKFTGVATTLPGVGAVTAMNFGTAAAPQATDTLNLTAGRSTCLNLQWAQPWASIDGHGSAYSLAAAVYDPSGNLVKTVAGATVGGDPVASGSFVPTVSGAYQVAVYATGGAPEGGTFKVIANNGSSTAASFAGSHGDGSVFGHAIDPDAITVGAVAAGDAPAFGGTLASEPFGAAGPGMLLFDQDGTPLATPRTLQAVDVSGPDGITTSLPASDLDPFYGTSCATPAVAALAALMKQANPTLTSGEAKAFLTSSALAFGTEAQSGAGLVQAPAALALAEESNTSLHGNLFGTGQSAILWEDGQGRTEVSQVASDALVSTASLAVPSGADWSAVATGDFSGAPGHGDILWRGPRGDLLVTLMQGTQVASTAEVAHPGAQWHVAGTGDFDGGGQSDILLDDGQGRAEILTMAGSALRSQTLIEGPGAGWSVAGIGDFNGDGKSDILWRDGAGDLQAWIMAGTAPTAKLNLDPAPGTAWSVAGTGDLSGDGRADILLQDSATGALDLWTMSGTGLASRTALTGTPGAGWQVAGLGAFDDSPREGILFTDDKTGAAMVADVGHGQITQATTLAGPGRGWSAMLG